MKIWIYGTGRYYQYYKKWIKQDCIAGFIDKDPDKQLKGVDGHCVICPEDVGGIGDAIVLVLIKEHAEIVEKLRREGIDETCIITYEDFGRHNWPFLNRVPIEVFGDLHPNEDAILCLTHNMDITGAEVALFEAAKVFMKQGKRVCVVSASDGKMREEFTNENITVIIDPNLLVDNIYNAEWIEFFHPFLLFLNTIYTYDILKYLDKSTRIVWWIHDPSACYNDISSVNTNLISSFNNLEIVAVSSIARNNFLKAFPGVDVGLMQFGLGDFYHSKKKHEEIIFASIGNVSADKGTDIVIRALEKMNDIDENDYELWIVGRVFENDFCKRIKRMVNDNKRVYMLGEMNRKELKAIYEQIDILICASYEETMSAVAVEAMMNYIPCVVTDNTGIADYVIDGKNGFIVGVGDTEKLKSIMEFCRKNRDFVDSMAENARQTYLEYFGLEQFGEKLKEIIGL